jgi:hypothetical protein
MPPIDFTALDEKQLLQFIAGTLQRIEQDMRQHTGAIIRALNEVRDEIKKV